MLQSAQFRLKSRPIFQKPHSPTVIRSSLCSRDEIKEVVQANDLGRFQESVMLAEGNVNNIFLIL